MWHPPFSLRGRLDLRFFHFDVIGTERNGLRLGADFFVSGRRLLDSSNRRFDCGRQLAAFHNSPSHFGDNRLGGDISGYRRSLGGLGSITGQTLGL